VPLAFVSFDVRWIRVLLAVQSQSAAASGERADHLKEMACLPKDALQPGQQWTCQEYAAIAAAAWSALAADFCPDETSLAALEKRACTAVRAAPHDKHGNIEDPYVFRYAACAVAKEYCGGLGAKSCKPSSPPTNDALNLAAAKAVWQIPCRNSPPSPSPAPSPAPSPIPSPSVKAVVIIVLIGLAFAIIVKL
jgi:hypothetical protein